jgi:recombination protein RecA
VELDIIFGKGIDRVASMLDAAELSGLVVRKGSWYSYGGKNIGQGRLNTLEYFKANPDQEVELELAVREALKEAELPPVGKVIVESANGDDDDVPPEMEDEDATPPLFDSVVAAVDA